MKIPKPPKGLKKEGRRFWKKVLTEFLIEKQHDLERLSMAAKCLDDVQAAEDQIEIDGRFTKNRYGNVIESPAAKVIRDTRLLFVKIIRELGLDLTNAPESRPPRKY